MNPYAALAVIAVTSVISFLIGGGIATLAAKNEINELKWAAVRVIADTRTDSYAAGEADAQARIALARAIEEGQQ